jgi:ribonucleoside-triphosphate reductase (thioredoxin)
VKQVMWENREHYNGISLLPYDGGTYVQAPFEEVSETTYRQMRELLPEVNLYDVQYVDSKKDERVQVLACSGGQCELV